MGVQKSSKLTRKTRNQKAKYRTNIEKEKNPNREITRLSSELDISLINDVSVIPKPDLDPRLHNSVRYLIQRAAKNQKHAIEHSLFTFKAKHGKKQFGADSDMRILSTRKDLQIETSNISPDRSQILQNVTSEMTLDSHITELDYRNPEVGVSNSL